MVAEGDEMVDAILKTSVEEVALALARYCSDRAQNGTQGAESLLYTELAAEFLTLARLGELSADDSDLASECGVGEMVNYIPINTGIARRRSGAWDVIGMEPLRVLSSHSSLLNALREVTEWK